MGAWIEIVISILPVPVVFVAPLVGAWIEISKSYSHTIHVSVAPLVGAWIEINKLVVADPGQSRSSRGSVD